MYNRFVETMAMHNDHRPYISLRAHQRGSSLVELLVGVAIGLMVISAAIGTLVLSRTTSLAVNDQLDLQQQGNMAMRIISMTLRQANTREATTEGSGNALLSPPPVYTGGTLYVQAFARDAQGNDDFGVAYTDSGGAAGTSTQDCLGDRNQPVAGVVPQGGIVNNRFFLNTSRLMCLGTNAGTAAQPLISDVQRLRVLYGVQTGTGAAASTRYYTQAGLAGLGPTPNIVALEICLELASAPRGTVTVAGNYTDCDGIVTPYDQRVRVIARQAVRLRAVSVS